MSKEKITSKKELQKALNMIAIDDWFDNPFFETPNISKEEYLKLYDDYIY